MQNPDVFEITIEEIYREIDVAAESLVISGQETKAGIKGSVKGGFIRRINRIDGILCHVRPYLYFRDLARNVILRIRGLI